MWSTCQVADRSTRRIRQTSTFSDFGDFISLSASSWSSNRLVGELPFRVGNSVCRRDVQSTTLAKYDVVWSRGNLQYRPVRTTGLRSNRARNINRGRAEVISNDVTQPCSAIVVCAVKYCDCFREGMRPGDDSPYGNECTTFSPEQLPPKLTLNSNL